MRELPHESPINRDNFVKSWCDLSIAIYDNGRITKITKDTEVEICQFNTESQIYSVYFQAGICVLQNPNGKYRLIDMFSLKWYEMDDDNLHYENMLKLLERSIFGLKFSDKYLLKIIGKVDLAAHIVNREKHTSEWREKTFYHPNFHMKNLNELLKKGGVEALTEKDIILERYYYKR